MYIYKNEQVSSLFICVNKEDNENSNGSKVVEIATYLIPFNKLFK